MVDIQSTTAEIRRGKNQEERRKKETRRKYNVSICYTVNCKNCSYVCAYQCTLLQCHNTAQNSS